MANRKRPQPVRDPKNLVVPLGGGVWVEPTPYEVHGHEIDGVLVDAELEWNPVDRVPYIVRLTVERDVEEEVVGEVTPEVLRKLTVPYLVSVASTQARFWLDSAGTIPSTDERRPDESLEHWAARLFWHCTYTRRSPAEYVAEAQGITPGSASQRLTVCRKMGLIGPDTDREKV